MNATLIFIYFIAIIIIIVILGIIIYFRTHNENVPSSTKITPEMIDELEPTMIYHQKKYQKLELVKSKLERTNYDDIIYSFEFDPATSEESEDIQEFIAKTNCLMIIILAAFSEDKKMKFALPPNVKIKRRHYTIRKVYAKYDTVSESVDANKFVKKLLSKILREVYGEVNISSILDAGYPVFFDTICFLREDFTLNGKTLMPKSIPANTPVNALTGSFEKKIPRIIHQCFQTSVLPRRYSEAALTWRIRNPEFTYHYYSQYDSRELIKKNFDARILDAYDNLIPGAFKCDMFRICAVYLYGGYYADIKMSCEIPISSFVPGDPSMVLVLDLDGKNIFNAFFGSYPRNPLFLQMLDQIVKNVEEKSYSINCLAITGPALWGKILREAADSSAVEAANILREGSTDILKDVYYMQYKFHNDMCKRRIVIDNSLMNNVSIIESLNINSHGSNAMDGKIAIYTRYKLDNDGLSKKITGLEEYGILCRQQKVYK